MARARSRLQDIIDRFEDRAAALEPRLDEPGVAEELRAEAQRALDEAIAVVDELRAELDGHAAAVAAPPPPAGAPASALRRRHPARIHGARRASVRRPVGAPSGWGGCPAPVRRARAGRSRPVRASGCRIPISSATVWRSRLPDGSTVMAPNPVAADAVRHALTQLGVPYVWGGTTPGVGLDCSGLTQWAYHEAGLNLPRLAQEQDLGAAVGQGSLRPGDLAVWDGHVAMIVGNGMMIEAGDPVKLSPIRTTNAGQGFQGFWRPTA